MNTQAGKEARPGNVSDDRSIYNRSINALKCIPVEQYNVTSTTRETHERLHFENACIMLDFSDGYVKIPVSYKAIPKRTKAKIGLRLLQIIIRDDFYSHLRMEMLAKRNGYSIGNRMDRVTLQGTMHV